MTQGINKTRTSRRRLLKATGAIVAGLAGPTFLRIGSALAAYPERPIKIVVANTPDAPSGDVDPDTQLVDLGVVDDDLAADLQAGVQSDLNRLGWHIKQGDITSTPSTMVSQCRTSVIKHAF